MPIKPVERFIDLPEPQLNPSYIKKKNSPAACRLNLDHIPKFSAQSATVLMFLDPKFPKDKEIGKEGLDGRVEQLKTALTNLSKNHKTTPLNKTLALLNLLAVAALISGGIALIAFGGLTPWIVGAGLGLLILGCALDIYAAGDLPDFEIPFTGSFLKMLHVFTPITDELEKSNEKDREKIKEFLIKLRAYTLSQEKKGEAETLKKDIKQHPFDTLIPPSVIYGETELSRPEEYRSQKELMEGYDQAVTELENLKNFLQGAETTQSI